MRQDRKTNWTRFVVADGRRLIVPPGGSFGNRSSHALDRATAALDEKVRAWSGKENVTADDRYAYVESVGGSIEINVGQ